MRMYGSPLLMEDDVVDRLVLERDDVLAGFDGLKLPGEQRDRALVYRRAKVVGHQYHA